MRFILEIIWLLLPAGAANIAPILARRINFLNYPVDFGRKISGQRIFGENKTWRGFFFGILASVLVVWFQREAFLGSVSVRSISFFDYSTVNIFFTGFLFGFAALFGDLIKSFFKRLRGIPSGQSWMPFDQIDWVVGALVAAGWFFDLTLAICLYSLIIGGCLHLIVNILGYLLKIKANKF